MTKPNDISQSAGRYGHTPKTWRLVAYIRELADLGCTGPQISNMLGVSHSTVGGLACKHKISTVRNRAEPLAKRIIRDGYAAGRKPSEIASELGISTDSVKVQACKMGLTRDATRDPGKHKRGYSLPAHLMGEYKALRKLGLTIRECGYELGLLKRSAPDAHVNSDHNKNISVEA